MAIKKQDRKKILKTLPQNLFPDFVAKIKHVYKGECRKKRNYIIHSS